jgi:spermidine/putrescine transport system ATP-binding protein
MAAPAPSPRPAASFLQFENVSKSFGPLKAVDSVSLEIQKGEFFSLLGPSGCGKTTLLRMLAGFETPDTGRILVDGQDVTALPPNRRKVNTIFQSYALFPHFTVRENIAFGPRVAGWPKERIDEEVERMLALTQLEPQARKKPGQISGGQKQRVAIARALINKPDVLLLDEPLAALDLKLRQRMQIELDLIHDQVGITFLYVTHDQGEAMSLSDRIAVMKDGRVEQIGPPAEIYETPRTSFVAAFIGDTNFLEGKVAEIVSGDYCRLAVDGFPEIVCFNDKQIGQGKPVTLSLRPEKLRVSRDKPEMDRLHNAVPGRIEDVIYLGNHTKYWVSVQEYRIAVLEQHNRFLLDETPPRWKQDVWVSWHADDAFMLEAYSESDEQLTGQPPVHVGDGS